MEIRARSLFLLYMRYSKPRKEEILPRQFVTQKTMNSQVVKGEMFRLNSEVKISLLRGM